MSLDNLYRMRDAHKRMKKSEETVHPVTDEEMDLGEHDRTLADIFQPNNKKEQDKFINRFCYEEDPKMAKEIAEALADEHLLTPEQDAFLSKMLPQYNLRTAQVEQLQERMTPEMMAHMGSNDPRIQEVIDKIGPEKAAKLFAGEFDELAMSDKKKFKKIVAEMREIHDLETHEITANLNARVMENLQRFGISEEEYWRATKSGLTAETKTNLQKLADESVGWFKRALGFSKRGADELYRNFADQSEILKECDRHMKGIGRVLQGTLTADVRLAIQKAMLEGGEVKDKKETHTVETIQDYRRAKEDSDPNPAAIKERYRKFEEAELKKRKITPKDLAAFKAVPGNKKLFDGIEDAFVKEEATKRFGYKAIGALASLLSVLFGSATTMPDIERDVRNGLK
ncbi:MAG TPA: hypothetical protein VG102_03930 [Candidatus Paceibacterota bacterium]|jgi:hypothetical protein|nr:hypothetical protein [Candidatus Paceibacterota bacterium]